MKFFTNRIFGVAGACLLLAVIGCRHFGATNEATVKSPKQVGSQGVGRAHPDLF
jgi:hypothetical protein